MVFDDYGFANSQPSSSGKRHGPAIWTTSASRTKCAAARRISADGRRRSPAWNRQNCRRELESPRSLERRVRFWNRTGRKPCANSITYFFGSANSRYERMRINEDFHHKVLASLRRKAFSKPPPTLLRSPSAIMFQCDGALFVQPPQLLRSPSAWAQRSGQRFDVTAGIHEPRTSVLNEFESTFHFIAQDYRCAAQHCFTHDNRACILFRRHNQRVAGSVENAATETVQQIPAFGPIGNASLKACVRLAGEADLQLHIPHTLEQVCSRDSTKQVQRALPRLQLGTKEHEDSVGRHAPVASNGSSIYLGGLNLPPVVIDDEWS